MEYLIILALIVINGLFSMSEAAVVSSRKSKLDADSKKGNKTSKRILEVAENPDNFLSTRLNDNRCWEYKKLAPKYNWWKEWHNNQLSNEWYIKKYYETVLNKLN